MAGKFLDRVYETPQDRLTALYDAWAESYDAELESQGYRTPQRIAAVLAEAQAPRGPVMDFGCGTGLAGTALAAAGFDPIDGCDVSRGMLDVARAKGVYRELLEVDPEDALPFATGAYPVIAASGVISAGAAPPGVLSLLIDALAPGGLLAFSYNGHTLEDEAYTGALNAALASGRVVERARDDGAHLPGIGLTSRIYLLERVAA